MSNKTSITNYPNIVLICPLNWGLGHATRLVPIIQKHIKQGDKPIIAASGAALLFLKKEFPNLEYHRFKGINIRYAKKPFLLMSMAFQMPLFALCIIYEYFKTKQLVRIINPSLIISDNRYGVRHSKVKSIIITHQLFIQLPKAIRWMQKPLHIFTHWLVSKFSECQVPDYEDYESSLSGKLSHGESLPSNIKYTGPLSRFQNMKLENILISTFIPDILIIISGPEPSRTFFEQEMDARFNNTNKTVLVVCGKPDLDNNIKEGSTKNLPMGITKLNHIKTEHLFILLNKVNKVIARAGYSTIMDLNASGCKAELIPTPGQTEQEYLAGWKNSQNNLSN